MLRTHRPAAFALALLLAPLLSGCRYNFVPLIPKTAHTDLNLPVRITQADLTREGEMLVLHAALSGHFEPGYLKATWFNNSAKLGEDSLFLDKDVTAATFKLQAPQPGAYRVALSFGGDVLRQADLYEVKP